MYIRKNICLAAMVCAFLLGVPTGVSAQDNAVKEQSTSNKIRVSGTVLDKKTKDADRRIGNGQGCFQNGGYHRYRR